MTEFNVNGNLLRSFPQHELTQRLKNSETAQQALSDLYHMIKAKDATDRFPTVDKIDDNDISRAAQELIRLLDQ